MKKNKGTPFPTPGEQGRRGAVKKMEAMEKEKSVLH
jgi:hypothetical protein